MFWSQTRPLHQTDFCSEGFMPPALAADSLFLSASSDSPKVFLPCQGQKNPAKRRHRFAQEGTEPRFHARLHISSKFCPTDTTEKSPSAHPDEHPHNIYSQVKQKEIISDFVTMKTNWLFSATLHQISTMPVVSPPSGGGRSFLYNVVSKVGSSYTQAELMWYYLDQTAFLSYRLKLHPLYFFRNHYVFLNRSDELVPAASSLLTHVIRQTQSSLTAAPLRADNNAGHVNLSHHISAPAHGGNGTQQVADK